jgi:hypothetical protein
MIWMHSPTTYWAILKSTDLAWAGLVATNIALAQIPKPTDAPKPMTAEALRRSSSRTALASFSTE